MKLAFNIYKFHRHTFFDAELYNDFINNIEYCSIASKKRKEARNLNNCRLHVGEKKKGAECTRERNLEFLAN